MTGNRFPAKHMSSHVCLYDLNMSDFVSFTDTKTQTQNIYIPFIACVCIFDMHRGLFAFALRLLFCL